MSKICKAAERQVSWKCWFCNHGVPHENNTDCFLKICDVKYKDVRCVKIEEL